MNYSTISTIAGASTVTPMVTQFDPTLITNGTSLVVQLVTALIAVLAFLKRLKTKQPV